MNFVKTRLFLDKVECGQSVDVLLDDGEPIESVSQSIQAEGHKIEASRQLPEGFHRLTIVKV